MRAKKGWISLVAALALACGALAGCGEEKETVKQTAETVKYYFLGTEPTELARVMERVNEALEKKIGVRIEAKYVNNDNYSLILSSGEAYDLIYVADWMQFWENATKGAFMEITDEMLEKYAPNSAVEEYAEFLSVGKHDGKRYGLPDFMKTYSEFLYIVRGDLMDKYGIAAIGSMDDFGKYLDAAAKNEQGMIPFGVDGSNAWQLHSIFLNQMRWGSPGAADAKNPLTIRIDDPDKKLFLPIETGEEREFSNKMRDWFVKGYWSQSALAAKGGGVEDFKRGKTAAIIANLNTANAIYSAFEGEPEKKGWDLRAYPVYENFSILSSHMNGGVAIGANSKKPDKALAVVDALRTDEALNKLLFNGIEGVHYKALPNNKMEDVALNLYPGPNNCTGMENDKYFLRIGGGLPEADEIRRKIAGLYVPNPLINFRADSAKLNVVKAALSDIYTQHTAVRYLGMFENVDDAIAVERQKLQSAGIERYLQDVQAQVDEYLKQNK